VPAVPTGALIARARTRMLRLSRKKNSVMHFRLVR
jgi:hypothetical protein